MTGTGVKELGRLPSVCATALIREKKTMVTGMLGLKGLAGIPKALTRVIPSPAPE